MLKKTKLQLSEEIFDMVVEYAAKKNPKRHYTAIIGDIEKILNSCEKKNHEIIVEDGRREY